MTGYVSASLRRLVAERADWLCEYCLIHERDTFLGCHVDHIVSEKHGGATIAVNLAYACAICNRAKGSDIAGLSPATGSLVRLFNPRIDRWGDNFSLDAARISGTTEIGLATASLLALNHPDRILEREALMSAGLYPSDAAALRIG